MVAVGLAASAARATPVLTTLTTFNGGPNGGQPLSVQVTDAAGDLYGTTYIGGAGYAGTVFEMVAGTHALTTLASFAGTANGAAPQAGLATDAAGNLYGTTVYGGSAGDGTVFELAAGTHALTVLASFNGTVYPSGGLTADAAGNLYGTTQNGGPANAGTVFEVAAGTRALTILASFTSPTDGANPRAGLTADAAGDLYGTTFTGGSAGDGTVFEVAAGTHALTTVAAFTGTANGAKPDAGLTADAAGDLYGTTSAGGSAGDGTVFEVAAGTHALTTLATFTGAATGSDPFAGLTIDAAGNLYGTTYQGGSFNDGTVFEVADGTHALTTLASFAGAADGAQPNADLTADAAGDLYGTTYGGGPAGDGTVFELTGSGFVTGGVPEPASACSAAGGVAARARARAAPASERPPHRLTSPGPRSGGGCLRRAVCRKRGPWCDPV